MKFHRRSIVKAGLALFTASAGGGAWYRYSRRRKPLDHDERLALTQLIDHMAPPDSVSLGAVDLGVDREIIGNTTTDRRTLGRYRHGLHRLNALSLESFGERFIALSTERQIQVVKVIENSDSDSVEYRFFHRLRKMTFEIFYSKPESWQSLNYPGPPQPQGFLDYSEAPKLGPSDDV